MIKIPYRIDDTVTKHAEPHTSGKAPNSPKNKTKSQDHDAEYKKVLLILACTWNKEM